METETLLTPGRKLIWWCRLLRDRLIAFCLHRFHRLYEDTSSRTLPSEEEFGMGVASPQYMYKCQNGSRSIVLFTNVSSAKQLHGF
jgi:hypothetical protein